MTPQGLLSLLALLGLFITVGLPAVPPVPRPVPDMSPAFVENRGQWDLAARFVADVGGVRAYLEPGAIVVRRQQRTRGHVLRLAFEAARASVELEGEQRLPGSRNYFLGNDPERWRRHVPGFASVLYRGLYDGVDLRVREQAGRLEYDLLLSQHANLDAIVIRCDGSDGLELDAEGALIVQTSLGAVRQPPPVTWQVLPSGEKRAVVCRYRLIDGQRYGFSVEDLVSPFERLVIDPGLEWSTYLGGTLPDALYDMDVDRSGAVTLFGITQSDDLPVTAGAYDTRFNPGGFFFPRDAYVCRITPDGKELVYCTYLGGSDVELGGQLVVSPDGVATVGGQTASRDFPTTPGTYDTTLGGAFDCYVTQLSADGSELIFSTYLGGNDSPEQLHAMALHPSGDVILAGFTNSDDFPTTPGAFDTVHFGIYVTRLHRSGSSLVFSTFLGGEEPPGIINDLALTPSGDIVVGGFTGASDFPVTPGAFSTDVPNAFVTCLREDGTELVFSTALGGDGPDQVFAVAVDPFGFIYVGGQTRSEDFPTTPGAFQTDPQLFFGADAFVTCFDPTGSQLVYSTYLVGGYTNLVHRLVVDSAGSVVAVGFTRSPNFPVTEGAYDTVLNVSGTIVTRDQFVTKLSPDGRSLHYSTFLGGEEHEQDQPAIATAEQGAVIVGSYTSNTDYPTTPGAFQTSNQGSTDAVVTKLDLLPRGVRRFGLSTAGCAGPLVLGVTAMPKAGGHLALTCTNAPPESQGGLLAVSLGSSTDAVPVQGAGFWLDPAGLLGLIPVHSNWRGYAELPARVPESVGATVHVQFFWPDLCAPQGLSASHALTLRVQPP